MEAEEKQWERTAGGGVIGWWGLGHLRVRGMDLFVNLMRHKDFSPGIRCTKFSTQFSRWQENYLELKKVLVSASPCHAGGCQQIAFPLWASLFFSVKSPGCTRWSTTSSPVLRALALISTRAHSLWRSGLEDVFPGEDAGTRVSGWRALTVLGEPVVGTVLFALRFLLNV